MKRASQEAVIEGSPQECFDAITDYESFPDWQSSVKECAVLTRDADGRGEHVRFKIDAKLKTVNYTLSYSYEEPLRIAWDYVEGDVKDVDGDLVLEDLGDGTTRAVYSLGLDAGVWMPGPVRKMLEGEVMKRSVLDLKRRVEGLA